MVAGEPPVVAVGEGASPVRWFLIDDWCRPIAPGRVPGPEWPCWEARYENDCERGKRTTRQLWGPTQAAVYRMNALLVECRERFGTPGLVTDPTMHGGGLHVMEPGGWLNCHLDYDLHPKLPGKRRAVNLIAFVHERWEPDWGGEFYLTDPLGKSVVKIEPRPGRLIVFETNDLSYHGVLPITGPAERVSVAVYLLADAGLSNTRERALFMPNRGL